MWFRGTVIATVGRDRHTLTIALADDEAQGGHRSIAAPEIGDLVYVAELAPAGEPTVDDVYAQITSLPLGDYLTLQRRIDALFAGKEDDST